MVIAFAGKLGEGAEACREHGIDSYFEIDRGTASMEEAMKPEVASRNLTDTVEKLCRYQSYGICFCKKSCIVGRYEG